MMAKTKNFPKLSPLPPKTSTMQKMHTKPHKFIEIHRVWPAIRKNNLILLEIQFTRQVSHKIFFTLKYAKIACQTRERLSEIRKLLLWTQPII